MSVSYIPDKVKYGLWGAAAGRCEYVGCNRRLSLDEVTKVEFNAAYIAHIVADKPEGPRGHPERSAKLAADPTNLMLMCDVHHRLIDKEDVAGHPVERLVAMKKLHEDRIDTVCGIPLDKSSHVLLYGANIGRHGAVVTAEQAQRAMLPDRYPAERLPIVVSLVNSSAQERDAHFWRAELHQIRSTLDTVLHPRIRRGDIQHLSVFALAPQPLLIALGKELSDIQFAQVFQRRKEPPAWGWDAESTETEFIFNAPRTQVGGPPALVLALSAHVTDERVVKVLGPDVAVWRLTIPAPDNDFVRCPAQTSAFRKATRRALDEIKRVHGEEARLHVFPAMPVSLAVELGRVWNAKADLPMVIYDENKALGGFREVIPLGGQDSEGRE